MKSFLSGKKILVAGGTGSIGSEIVRYCLRQNPEVVRIYSRDEAKQFEMQQELREHGDRLRFLIGDVRDQMRLMRACEDIEVVFHAAALKHVPACEFNPFEAVKTNVLGTQNVIECALSTPSVQKVVGISTDKATNPTNTLGATKLLSERLIASADYYKGGRKIIFTCIRFGNVLGSRGSVIPLFKKQIMQGGPVTVTHPDMTRFVMSIPQAVHLAMDAAEKAKGGEIFILKMPAFRIIDLARVMVEQLAVAAGKRPENIKTEMIGLRPGEKLHEDLMTEEETQSAESFSDMFMIKSTYFRVSPNGNGTSANSHKPTANRVYSSKYERLLTKEELKALLLRENLLY